MLVGQQLGPFLIDRELGSGAMGAVYRGKYVKTGQLVAVKVMAPGLGNTNPNAVARFEREASILKQLNHPNIVRLFGVGKHQGTRFYAMEYVVGESLDRVMARRDRMSWEEVVALGRQLCAALQHAHEAGIVHRDLKPSNLMILPDGTLKLTDFGIAKDLDVTALTEANCTVGTAAYMSPEQCKGERDLTPKSDLYSMGVVFYELITGKKPFMADNAMEMFMMHVQGTFTRPSRLVLDMPVWLDNLICQLLEKSPDHRPMNAAMVYGVLGSIQEKVEAQQSAGVDAVRGRMIDRPRGARNPDEADKDVARTLLGGKGKVRRKKKTVPFYRRLWFSAVCLVLLLTAAVGLLLFLLRPASPEALYAEAEKQMKSKDPEEHEKAYQGAIRTYLDKYATRPGDQTAQMAAWKQQREIEQVDETLQILLKNKFAHPKNDAETDVRDAAQAENDGDVPKAKKRWQDAAKKYDKASGYFSWGLLAQKRLDDVQRAEKKEKQLLGLLDDMRLTGREPSLDGPEKEACLAVRAEHFGDLFQGGGDLPGAYRRYDDLKDHYAKDPDLRFWYLFAANKSKELEPHKPAKGDDDARKNLVQAALDAVQGKTVGATDSRVICLNIVALYDGDPDLKDLVKQARQFLDAR